MVGILSLLDVLLGMDMQQIVDNLAISEDMSQALGEHEVERDKYSRNSSSKGSSTNRSPERNRERVVMPSEIASLPELTGYVAFAGNFPISRVKLEWVEFTNRLPAFEERSFGHA